MIKPNGLVIVISLLVLFICSDVSKKNLVNSMFILIAILGNFFFTKFYIHDLQSKHLKFIKVDKGSKVNEVHPTLSFNLVSFHQLKNISPEMILKNKSKFITAQLNEINNNVIYHSKTFLILNKILSKTKINLKVIEIPINLFIWLMIIFLITYFISKKR